MKEPARKKKSNTEERIQGNQNNNKRIIKVLTLQMKTNDTPSCSSDREQTHTPSSLPLHQ